MISHTLGYLDGRDKFESLAEKQSVHLGNWRAGAVHQVNWQSDLLSKRKEKWCESG